MRIVLQPHTELLEEVVVTAMGQTRNEKSLGYAVQGVKADKLAQGGGSSLAGALQGKVSGVTITSSSGMPGASSRITIRGARSFVGDNTPLYVVDGQPIISTADSDTGYSVTGSDYATRYLDIDPNDIESVNILKGQAASALYGMRATNGVIIITTKKGKTNATAGKPEISFNSNIAFDEVSVLPKFQTEYAQGANGAYVPVGSAVWGPKVSELPNDPTYGGNTDNAYTQQYGKKPGMYYVPQRAYAGLDPWAMPQTYDNVGEFFNTAVNWNNSLSVTQNTGKGFYSFSLGNTLQHGIVPNTGMERYNVKLAAETKLHDNWTTGFVGNFSASKVNKSQTANNGIAASLFGGPTSYDMAGIPDHYEGDPSKQNNFRTGSFDQPYWATSNNVFEEKTQRFFGNAYVSYNTKLDTDNMSLTLKYQLGDDAYTNTIKNIWAYGAGAYPTGSANSRNYTVNELNSLFTATYNWNINEDFIFDALVGNEFINYSREQHSVTGTVINFAGWDHVDNASAYTGYTRYRTTRTVGNFANVALSWKNQLYLNATGRVDRVSNMPTNSRTYFYPSVSLGWIFTELDALRNNGILNYGKLRVSYAQVGQAGDYYQTYYSKGSFGGGFSMGTPLSFPIDGVVGIAPSSTVYDAGLVPQNTVSYEGGIDMNFLNGLFTLSYTYSRQNIKDQIFDVPLAASTGSGTLVTNGGSMHTNTHEFTLGINPIDTRNFKWDMTFNFTKIDNYVDELTEGVPSIMLGGFTEPQVRVAIGYKYPVIYGVTYNRNPKGEILVDKNGLPTAGAEDVIGNVEPDFRLNYNTTFEIYKLRLSATLDWKQGGQMYAGTKSLMDNYGTSQRSADYRAMEAEGFLFELPAVKQTGGEVTYDENGKILTDTRTYAPNDIKINNARTYMTRLNAISESFIADNSFIKLREISASYPVYSKPGGMSVTLSAFARNIIVWSELKGFDPEATQGNNNMQGAFERFSLPGTSSYGLGVNVKF
jgi:TonB-linked SusC/RagA family outer membrane protein